MIWSMQLCICHLCSVGFLISLSFFTLRSGWAGCLSSSGFSSTCVGCTWGLCRWSFSPSSRWGLILATLQLESKSYCPWLCLASVSQTFPTVSPLVLHQQSLVARHEVEAFLINAARIECAISLWTCLWQLHIHAHIHTHSYTYRQLCWWCSSGRAPSCDPNQMMHIPFFSEVGHSLYTTGLHKKHKLPLSGTWRETKKLFV